MFERSDKRCRQAPASCKCLKPCWNELAGKANMLDTTTVFLLRASLRLYLQEPVRGPQMKFGLFTINTIFRECMESDEG